MMLTGNSLFLIVRVQVAIFLLLFYCSLAEAHTSYQSDVPNGGRVPGHSALGHRSATTGDALNSFGILFRAVGYRWTKSLCEADSDNDGQSNGLELGDPDCTWTAGTTPARATDISDPTSASSTTAALPSDTSTPVPLAVSLEDLRSLSGLIPIVRSPPQDLFPSMMSLNWTVYHYQSARHRHRQSTSASASDDILEVTMVLEGDIYGAVGVSQTGMEGPFVCCYVPPDLTTEEALCGNFHSTSSYAVTRRSDSTVVMQSSRSGSKATVTFRTLVDQFGLSGKKGKSLRTIFAYGQWQAAAAFPKQHTSAGRSSRVVNFYSGSSVKASKTKIVVGYVIGVTVPILVTLIGFALKLRGWVPTARTRTYLWVFIAALYVVLIILVIVLAHSSYKDQGKTAPAGRAFGDGVAYLFFLILWPSTKHIGPAQLLGMSYERLLPLHFTTGLLILVFMTTHFGVLWSFFASGPNGQHGAQDAILVWDGEGGKINIAGFLSWLLLMIVVLPALFLRRRFYGFFRVSHGLAFPLVIVFGAVHHWPLWVLVGPFFLSWVIDVILRLVSNQRHKPKLISSTYHAKADIVELQIGVSPSVFKLEPCQHVYLTFKSVGGLLHPFSVAGYDSGVVEFFIRPSREGSWTRKVAGSIQAGRPLGDPVWFGPYGQIQIPLDYPNHFVVVAGGIGVTPMMSLLQCLSEPKPTDTASLKRTDGKSLLFVWAVKDTSVVSVLGPHIEADLARIRQAGGTDVQAFVHVTQGGGADGDVELDEAPSSVVPASRKNSQDSRSTVDGPPLLQTIHGRPKIGEYLQAYQGEKANQTAVYVCGPESLMQLTTAEADKRKITHHSEAFEF